ncbi:MAG: hypothetical protein ACI8V2_002750 [Candidatus Latescibacterota bacterium]|jgi:hypothetical protein
MAIIELEYSGGDLVISQETAEKTLGLHPGDRIEVRLKPTLTPIKLSREESTQITDSFEHLRDAFEPSNLDDWETRRNELWSKWQVPT